MNTTHKVPALIHTRLVLVDFATCGDVAKCQKLQDISKNMVLVLQTLVNLPVFVIIFLPRHLQDSTPVLTQNETQPPAAPQQSYYAQYQQTPSYAPPTAMPPMHILPPPQQPQYYQPAPPYTSAQSYPAYTNPAPQYVQPTAPSQTRPATQYDYSAPPPPQWSSSQPYYR